MKANERLAREYAPTPRDVLAEALPLTTWPPAYTEREKARDTSDRLRIADAILEWLALRGFVLTRREPLDVLPPDTVCACLHETGERKVRLYERCERCGAFMEADREPLDVEVLAEAIHWQLKSVGFDRPGCDDAGSHLTTAEQVAAEYARLEAAEVERGT